MGILPTATKTFQSKDTSAQPVVFACRFNASFQIFRFFQFDAVSVLMPRFFETAGRFSRDLRIDRDDSGHKFDNGRFAADRA